MPSRCAVPYCKTSKYKVLEKFSTFQVPIDENLRRKWIEVIPGIEVLRKNQRVCEKHFEEHLIIKEYVKYDNTGEIIAQVPLQHPRLQPGAIPSIFDPILSRSRSPQTCTTNTNRHSDHLYAMSMNQPTPSNLFTKVENVSTTVNYNQDINAQQNLLEDNNSTNNVFGAKTAKQFSSKNFISLRALADVDSDTNVSQPLNEVPCSSLERNVQHCSTDIVQNTCSKDNVSQTSSENSGSSPLTFMSNSNIPAQPNQLSEKQYEAKQELSSSDGFNSEFATEYRCSTVNITFDSISFNLNPLFDTTVVDTDRQNVLLKIPKPWNACKSISANEEILLFTYIVEANDGGADQHIFEKTVIIKASREIIYEVYSTRVNVSETKLPEFLVDISVIPDILNKFKDLRVCKGITSVDANFVQANMCLKMTTRSDWRHQECTILSLNNERCVACKKYCKTRVQKARRMKNKKLQRCLIPVNSMDQTKLKALRNKIKSRRRKICLLNERLKVLSDCITKHQTGVANVTDADLEKVSKNQRMVIHEIVSAAKKTDPRGHRYTEEFIMLCMLMNIRSQSYYEFLRKNEIIPLPCTKTIRNYMSFMGTKCGFDDDFFKLLTKSFEAKDPQKRHGVLTLDEINVRKSVAVSSRTLSYTGLVNCGDDGPQSNSIEDLATHGLVLQFQSLTEKYTQPIAVFASKNSVGGENLAKIVVKAICLLENAGALIHGVIGDGASTNRTMWKTLNINSTIDELQSWFSHPLHDNRKVFMFSDTPHLIKCIRNRLYDKKRLRINPDDNYIKWEYFTHLYDVDNALIGNARVCPRISRRHIELDNTAKMRVRFATQIFSNSVAVGLRFYLAHKMKEFEGCETTADFCLQMNNLFDALNRKQPNEGLKPDSKDFKILEDTLEWLNKWERNSEKRVIPEYEFLTKETAHGLRVTIRSTLDLCKYLIEEHDFKYLLTGKVNQDNLEKFFGTIRGAAGSNEHPTCPTFLLLYKLLSVYSLIKPPKYGNCTVTEKQFERVITVSDLKDIRKNSESKTITALQNMKNKLDDIIKNEEWEVDQIIEQDYSLSPVVNCIIYYVTGFDN